MWSVASHGESNRLMKGELEALGEEVDDNIESISKVQTQILNLTHGKVNIFDDYGDFRNYYEIMKDISEIFNELSSTEQASLSELLFGKVRGNQGIALIQAFQSGQIEAAYEVAKNSAGSAFEEQSRWMSSLEAKTNTFKAAFQELSNTVLDADLLKTFVDWGTGGLEALTWLTGGLDSFGAKLTGVIALMSGISKLGNSGWAFLKDKFSVGKPNVAKSVVPTNTLVVTLNESIEPTVGKRVFGNPMHGAPKKRIAA